MQAPINRYRIYLQSFSCASVPGLDAIGRAFVASASRALSAKDTVDIRVPYPSMHQRSSRCDTVTPTVLSTGKRYCKLKSTHETVTHSESP